MSRDTYSRGDPETGCGLLMLVGGILALVVWAAVWLFFGLQGVVLLLLASIAVVAVVNVLHWKSRR